jgi:hypothetical protein
MSLAVRIRSLASLYALRGGKSVEVNGRHGEGSFKAADRDRPGLSREESSSLGGGVNIRFELRLGRNEKGEGRTDS